MIHPSSNNGFEFTLKSDFQPKCAIAVGLLLQSKTSYFSENRLKEA